MSRIFLKPLDGKQIPSPDHGGKFLPAEGAEVELSTYWSRRLDEKDVERVTPEAEAEAAPQPPAKPVRNKGDAQ